MSEDVTTEAVTTPEEATPVMSNEEHEATGGEDATEATGQ